MHIKSYLNGVLSACDPTYCLMTMAAAISSTPWNNYITFRIVVTY